MTKKKKSKPTTKDKWPPQKITRLLGNVKFDKATKNDYGENLPSTEQGIEQGIEPAPIPHTARIGILGYGPLVQTMKAQLGATLFSWPVQSKEIKDIDVLIAPSVGYKKIHLLKSFVKKYPSVQLIFWWIGTDVLRALEEKRPWLRQVKATHLCVSQNLQRELETIGIKSEVLIIPPVYTTIIPSPGPETYTVASYLPNNKLEFYHWSTVSKIAELCPETRFIIFGARNRKLAAPTNVEVRGWIDTDQLFHQTNCLLRLTKHDGFSKCIIEAKHHNRVVITNHNIPYVVQMKAPEKIARFINTCPEPSKEGYDYYQRFTYDVVKARFGR